MSGPIQRRLGVLLASAAAAFGVWKYAPGTALDRTAFTTVASGSVNGPLFVTGRGTQVAPWKLRAFATETRPDKRQAPVIVSLGDDPDQVFNSSPPAPIDLAVIFRNFQRLGAKKAATAAVLAWEAPDPLGLAALENSMAKFDALVTAVPLSRGAVASPIPPAFRRASIPLASIHGDPSDLPVVNRIPIPGVILGGENAVAGFSMLESEPAGSFPPLVARWDDRVVLSFPLLTALQRANLPISGIGVWPGKYLKLGPAGPIVPIDRYGRLALPLKSLAPFAVISAESLIDGGDKLFPKEAPDPVILRDDRSAAEPATRAFSRSISAVIAAISSDAGMGEIQSYPRLKAEQESAILAVVVVLLAAICGLPTFRRNLLALLLAGSVISAQWIGFGTGVWLPGLALLAAISAMAVVSAIVRKKQTAEPDTRIEDPPSTPDFEPIPFPETSKAEIPPPATKAVKKEAPRKNTPKKAPAKKATKPKGTGGKRKPPTES